MNTVNQLKQASQLIKNIAVLYDCNVDVERITTGTKEKGFRTFEITGKLDNLRLIQKGVSELFPEINNYIRTSDIDNTPYLTFESVYCND
jgi:hypothetical protein